MTGNSRFAVSLHVLAYLAYQSGRPVPSAEIASSVVTNPVVIRRLLSSLVQARLVTTQKGAAGGFALARPAAKISLLEVYRAVEPQAGRGLKHFAPNHRCPVGARIGAILEGVFARAHAALETELGRTTLGELEKQLHPVCPSKR